MMPAVETEPHYYNIADHIVKIVFADTTHNGVHLIPSFGVFEQDESDKQPFLCVYVDDKTQQISSESLEVVGQFDGGNGETTVERNIDGKVYQYKIKDIYGRNCCLLQTDENFSQCRCALRGDNSMRQFGLNSALMLAYAFRGSYENTMMIHASLVRHKGFGYAFIAKSGTGKSTQVSSWLRYIAGCDLMNDDSPIVRLIDDEAYIYGSPWSGKTPCYRKVKAKLGAITKIDRANDNSIETLSPVFAASVLLPALSTMRWDERIFDNTCKFMASLIERVDTYILHCLPNKEAAMLCHKTIVKE